MSVQLDPSGREVRVGATWLSTPGLTGTAQSAAEGAPAARRRRRVRGSAGPPPAASPLDQVLAQEGFDIQQEIEVGGTRTMARAGVVRLRTRYGEPALSLRVPTPAPGSEQLVLSKNESDLITWHFAEPQPGVPAGADKKSVRGDRTPSTRSYVIPRRVPRSTSPRQTRSLLGAVGQKLIKVLVFPLAGGLVGKAAERFAAKWETKKRPYRLRSFTPDNYRDLEGSGVDWKLLSGGRALLVVHGTLTRAHTEFSMVPDPFVRWLDQRYEGRMFAFDHFTLSEDPAQNVRWLLANIPDGTSLDLDIICISRGGLVTREIAEQQKVFSLGSRQLQVHRVVFVAAPNAGTALADPKHIGDFLDTYTNILNLVPDSPATYVLEGLCTIAKLVAVNVLKGLSGLAAMRPDGPFLQALNIATPGDQRYFAVASNFEPAHAGFRDYARDILVDRIFGGANDLMVPTSGVFDPNGSSMFPIPKSNRLVFAPTDGISHSGYLRNALVQQRIMRWLGP